MSTTSPIKPIAGAHNTCPMPTSSAQSALDSTGQHLMTVDAEGTIEWATPQTYALLARARADERWLDEQLSPQLRQWLKHQPALNQQLKLEALEYGLSVKLVGYQQDGSKLLKLVDSQRISGSATLKAQLAITERESEVLHWVANGKTNREIAEILDMSPRTVNKHLEQIYPKLGVENRTAAAGIALRLMAQAEIQA